MGENTATQCFVEIVSIEKDLPTILYEKAIRFDKEGYDGPFITVDLGEIIKQHRKWENALPRIKPFYAVKCNTDTAILKVLADIGASFDCASKKEIEAILNLGVAPSRIIYANTCKQASMLKYATDNRVVQMTFDNESELNKIKMIHSDAKLVLRIRPSSSFNAEFPLGKKCGCDKEEGFRLLKSAYALGMNVVGISFHVGTGCNDAKAFAVMIKGAREMFDYGNKIGFNMQLLDIGGGLPGIDAVPVTFEQFADSIRGALDEYFPEGSGVEVIAEPGTYYVQTSSALAVQIISKRVRFNGECTEDDDDNVSNVSYYLNDGTYGTLYVPCLESDNRIPHVLPFNDGSGTFNSTLWGPTCDSLDCITDSIQLPDLQVGQWLYFDTIGAYNSACSSSFNGMPKPKRCYYCPKHLWNELYPRTTDVITSTLSTSCLTFVAKSSE